MILLLSSGWQEAQLLPVFNCCKQHPDFEWHHPSFLNQGSATALGVLDPKEALA